MYYNPKTNKQVNLQACLDTSIYDNLVSKIKLDKRLSCSEKKFLSLAATKFIIPKYSKFADLYVQTNPVIQQYLEDLRLVIVDDEKMIADGYFKYLQDYSNLIGEMIAHEK